MRTIRSTRLSQALLTTLVGALACADQPTAPGSRVR